MLMFHNDTVTVVEPLYLLCNIFDVCTVEEVMKETWCKIPHCFVPHAMDHREPTFLCFVQPIITKDHTDMVRKHMHKFFTEDTIPLRSMTSYIVIHEIE